MTIRYKKCFTCGSLDVAKIIYGYPTAEAFKDQEAGKIKLSGCVISEDSPSYHCKQCGKQWTADEAIDAAYNEIIGLRASVGGYFEGYYDVTIHFQNKKITWKYSLDGDSLEKELLDTDITTFINGLKMVDLLNWERRYEELDVLDDTQWEVEIIRDKRNLIRSGSNKFPAEWECFCNLIRTISGSEFE
ncbi:TPA: hypothetical protein RF418_002603 [Listeria monocytogenes]|nr:hypothetical protein [Listeria monocytogenes]